MKEKIQSLLLIIFTSCCCYAQIDQSEKHRDHHTSMSESPRSYADSVNAGIIKKDTLKQSVFRMAMDYVGKNHVHIEYASPGVRGRTIWGGLVAYDEVWVAGAHAATTIQFSKDISVNGTVVKKGKYAFFTIPGHDIWTLILNTNWEQHLADEYNAKDDVIRVTVKPEVNDKITPRLTYIVKEISDREGEVILEWEKVRLVLPFRNSK